MEQTQPPSSFQTTLPVASPLPQRPPSAYFIRIFEGRLNRQNYGAGSLLLLVIPFLCFLLFFGSLLFTPGALTLLQVNPYDTAQLQNPALESDNLQKTITGLETSPINITAEIILSLYMLITLPINLAFQVRRLHDMNQSGWLLLLNIVPLVGYVFPFYVTFFPGTNGANKYGANPLPRVNILEDILKLSPKKKTSATIGI